MTVDKPIPLSLRRKSSARVAAVQCVYRLKITSEDITAEALLEDYLSQWQDDKTSSSRVISRDADPDKNFLRKLLTGVMEKKEEMDEILKSSLNDKWTMERMSPLLTSILTCAIYELRYAGALNLAIIVNEYVTLTGRFFEAPEVGFVNGLLDTMAKELKRQQ